MMKDNNPFNEAPLPPELKVAIEEMREIRPVEAFYPWPEMEVGDSVLFRADKGESVKVLRNRVGDSAYHYGKISGKKFETKFVTKKNAFRVWRTE